jgi:hypothetical protein
LECKKIPKKKKGEKKNKKKPSTWAKPAYLALLYFFLLK